MPSSLVRETFSYIHLQYCPPRCLKWLSHHVENAQGRGECTGQEGRNIETHFHQVLALTWL